MCVKYEDEEQESLYIRSVYHELLPNNFLSQRIRLEDVREELFEASKTLRKLGFKKECQNIKDVTKSLTQEIVRIRKARKRTISRLDLVWKMRCQDAEINKIAEKFRCDENFISEMIHECVKQRKLAIYCGGFSQTLKTLKDANEKLRVINNLM